jgi:peptide deformylase
MAIREVLQLGNPILREAAEPVVDPRAAGVQATLDDLRDTLATCRARTGYGRGMAAPQIGVLRRIVFLNVPGMDRPWPLINPEILERSPETALVWDACLSFLDIFMRVERHREITVRWQDPEGVTHTGTFGVEHDLAELLQHEVDHLDGVLAIDRVTDIRTIVTRGEFERRYRADSPYREG